jgi:two-component system chemotaxis response regulator CheB
VKQGVILMGKLRVLVVDDAVVVRKIVSDELASDPEIEVVGTAANGKIALQKIPQVNPDVITMDVEMPEMNGIETVRALRKDYPKLPVIMFSTLTERGASTTMDALSAGASDYVAKPANVGKVGQSRERVKEELLAKIKALCKGVERPRFMSRAPEARSIGLPSRVRPVEAEIVAIGVSTGGPNALAELIPVFPQNFHLPIVIVQHMPPLFTRLLAERLSAQSSLNVHEGEEGMVLEAGHAYIAPGDYHMVLRRDGAETRLALNQDPQENSCRPAVDVLFRSVVELYAERTLGVILTGMGHDGLRGCEMIREAQGRVLCQDEASSVVWGMPGCVSEAGLADAVVPLEQLGKEILQRCEQTQAKKSSASMGVEAEV